MRNDFAICNRTDLVLIPQDVVDTTVTSEWVDMKYYDEATFQMVCGTVGASGTLDMKLQQAPSGSPTTGQVADMADTDVAQVDPGNSALRHAYMVTDKFTNDKMSHVRAAVTAVNTAQNVSVVAIRSHPKDTAVVRD